MKKLKFLFAASVTSVCSAVMAVKAFAETSASVSNPSGDNNNNGGLQSLIPFVLMIAVFGLLAYFMIIRPDKKRRKEAEEMRSGIKVGDNVTTIGGIIGTVASISGDTFTLDNGIKFRKTAIYTIDDKDIDLDDEKTAAVPDKKEEKK